VIEQPASKLQTSRHYSQANYGTQGKTAKNTLKMRFFAWYCGNCRQKWAFLHMGRCLRAFCACVILAISYYRREKDMSGVPTWEELSRKFDAEVKLPRRPVAVAFLDSAPAGVQKFDGTEPSGCSFWRLAANGRVFYTVPENHFNCAVGAYTHSIALSPEREKETEQTLKMMFDLGYVKPEEVPQIPRLAKTPAAIVFAPLEKTPVAPDVVLFACNPSVAMLLSEAASRAGVGSGIPALGRPTCMALPASLQHGSIVSLGCMGNRVYTGLGEEEMYLVIRGKDLSAVADALHVIVTANAALNDYAKGRRSQLATV
jgi:uncharacterized protein (DUF169 family)